MPATTISAAVEGPTAWIRIVGRACAERARDFGGAVERFRDQGVRDVVLDLGECRLMDSTFSGVLTGLVESQNVQPLCFTLVNPSVRVTDLLDNLGVLPLVRVLNLTKCVMPAQTDEVGLGGHSQEEHKVCCLEAHRLLMGLKPENQARFADLTRMLEQDLQRAEPLAVG